MQLSLQELTFLGRRGLALALVERTLKKVWAEAGRPALKLFGKQLGNNVESPE